MFSIILKHICSLGITLKHNNTLEFSIPCINEPNHWISIVKTNLCL